MQVMGPSRILSDDLSRHLRDRILKGEFRGGESISETGVAAEYGVARPTARSALDRLVVDSLLVRQAHASLRVREVSGDDLRELLEILEFLAGRAVQRVVTRNADLRELSGAVNSSVHHFLDVLVAVSGSESSARFHRQSTFEFVLGSFDPERASEAEAAPVPREARSGLLDALWRGEADLVTPHVKVLWTYRRSLAQSVLEAEPTARSAG
jgi:hypothetical protein